MSKVNFITTYLAAYEIMMHDERLSSTQLSLYFTLLYFYNFSRFSVKFSVARMQIKKLSKIKSDTTYSNSIAALVDYGYIVYHKSNSPHVASLFSIIDLTKVDRSHYTQGSTSPVNGTPMTETVPENGLVDDISSPNNGIVPHISSPENGTLMSLTSPKNGTPVYTSKTYKQNNKTLNVKSKEDFSFSPPTKNESIDFFLENACTRKEGEKFFYHYTANGWKIGGKTAMVDWEASAHNWMNRAIEFQSSRENYFDSDENKDYSIPL